MQRDNWKETSAELQGMAARRVSQTWRRSRLSGLVRQSDHDPLLIQRQFEIDPFYGRRSGHHRKENHIADC
jgi:hypothetical protein